MGRSRDHHDGVLKSCFCRDGTFTETEKYGYVWEGYLLALENLILLNCYHFSPLPLINLFVRQKRTRPKNTSYSPTVFGSRLFPPHLRTEDPYEVY